MARRAGARPSAFTRREFLLSSLAAGASLMLADRSRSATARTAAPRVVIIGAGYGGLSCAYQLQRAGAQVTMLEARQRLGGRVHSLDSLLSGKRVEAGGELIGLNHPTWLDYAKRFGFSLSELPESDEADSPILIDGRRLVGKEVAQIWSVLDQVLQSMNNDARTINRQQPWLSAKLMLQSGAVLEADTVVLTAPPTTGWPAAAPSKC
jgi:monoamine oxidase